MDPETNQLVGNGIEEQTQSCLNNLNEMLKASGLSMQYVVKATVFLKYFDDFEAMNEVYRSIFVKDFPARVCVEVARLPRNVLVEIEAISVYS